MYMQQKELLFYKKRVDAYDVSYRDKSYKVAYKNEIAKLTLEKQFILNDMIQLQNIRKIIIKNKWKQLQKQKLIKLYRAFMKRLKRRIRAFRRWYARVRQSYFNAHRRRHQTRHIQKNKHRKTKSVQSFSF